MPSECVFVYVVYSDLFWSEYLSVEFGVVFVSFRYVFYDIVYCSFIHFVPEEYPAVPPFFLELAYKVPTSVVDEHLAQHVEFLKEQYGKGNFLASGRKVPRTGGIILSNVSSKEELEQIIAQDPFNQNGVADYEIVEFIPSMTCQEFDFLKG